MAEVCLLLEDVKLRLLSICWLRGAFFLDQPWLEGRALMLGARKSRKGIGGGVVKERFCCPIWRKSRAADERVDALRCKQLLETLREAILAFVPAWLLDGGCWSSKNLNLEDVGHLLESPSHVWAS